MRIMIANCWVRAPDLVSARAFFACSIRPSLVDEFHFHSALQGLKFDMRKSLRSPRYIEQTNKQTKGKLASHYEYLEFVSENSPVLRDAT